MIENGIKFAATTAVGLCAKKVAKNKFHSDTTEMKPGEKIITKVGEFAIISGLTCVAKTWVEKVISDIAIGLKCGKILIAAKDLINDAEKKFTSDDYIPDTWADDVAKSIEKSIGPEFDCIKEDDSLFNDFIKMLNDTVKCHNDRVEIKKSLHVVDTEIN